MSGRIDGTGDTLGAAAASAALAVSAVVVWLGGVYVALDGATPLGSPCHSRECAVPHDLLLSVGETQASTFAERLGAIADGINEVCEAITLHASLESRGWRPHGWS